MIILVALLLFLREICPTKAIVISLFFNIPIALISYNFRHMCKVLPLKKTKLSVILSTLLGAALLVSGIWTGLFYLVSYFLKLFSPIVLQETSLLLGSLGTLCFVFSLIYHYMIIAIEHTNKAELKEKEARQLSKEAQLKALRAQFNPHFLFNSLNSVAALTTISPQKAQTMILLLSSFFRDTLKAGSINSTSLKNELDLILRYLQIEEIRFSDKMELKMNISKDCLDILIPPLCLQPLVENAIKHGVSNSVEETYVSIDVFCEKTYVTIKIENEFDPEVISKSGSKSGLRITKERIDNFFNNNALFSTNAVGNKFIVEISIPKD